MTLAHYRLVLIMGVAMLSLVTGVHAAENPAEVSLALVQDGQPAASIVIARDATRVAQFAASELQWHLAQITGAQVPIIRDDEPIAGTRILVGESALTKALDLVNADFGMQEYLIRFLPDTLVLMGQDKEDQGTVTYDPNPDAAALQTWPSIWDEQGTMHAVYDFLERYCDVRWLNPTETGMDCPKTASLTVTGSQVRRAPFFRYRFSAYPTSENYDAYTGLWRSGTDGFKAWEALAFEDLHERFPDHNDYIHAKRGWVQLFRFRMREGGEKCIGNHSLYNYYKRFWEADPANADAFEGRKVEWFAKGYEGTPPQLCYTDRGLIEQVAKDACDYFDGKGINPWTLAPVLDRNDVWGENFFCVEPMDNEAFCKCEQCQDWLRKEEADSPFFSNGRHSDYFFNFVNEIAREVRKTHPDKWIVTLAYMSHTAPPTRVKLEPNVAVQFCFACNRLNYDRPSYEHEIDLMNQWATTESERPLYLWLYYTFPVEIANGRDFHCFPGFFAHAIEEQFRLFQQHGMRGMFHCGYGQDVEAYVTYKLMDDPAASVDALLDDYFRRLYGAAGEPMKQLYLAIEQTYSDPANYPEAIATGKRESHHHQTEEMAWGYLGTERRMAQFASLLEQAQDLASTPLEEKRVELFKLGVWDYMVAGRRLYAEHTKMLHGGTGPAVRVPFASGEALDGDPARMDPSEAMTLLGWRSSNGEPTRRDVSARLVNDGDYLYVRLEETAPKSVEADADVLGADYWDILIAGGRSAPYREIAISPTGDLVCREFSADGGALPITWQNTVVANSDTSDPGRWTVDLALPLATLLPGDEPAKGRVFMNLARRSAASDDEPMAVPTFGDFRDTTSLKELVLDAAETIPSPRLSAGEVAALRTRDLVAFWPLDEATGAGTGASSPNALEGALVNGPTWVRDGGRTVVHLDDSARQCVDLGNSPEVNLTGPLSFEAWVKYEASQTWYPAIMGKGYETTGAYNLHMRPGRTLWFEIDAEDGTRHHYNPTDLSVTPGVWTHLAATYDGATMRVYVNGREAGPGKQVATAIRTTAEPLRVGWLGSYGHLNGCVRDVALYSRALSAGEVFAHYAAGR